MTGFLFIVLRQGLGLPETHCGDELAFNLEQSSGVLALQFAKIKVLNKRGGESREHSDSWWWIFVRR